MCDDDRPSARISAKAAAGSCSPASPDPNRVPSVHPGCGFNVSGGGDALPPREVDAMRASPRIVVLDGHTINPGDNPWTPLESLGDLTVHEGTPPGLAIERARHAEVLLTSKVKLDAGVLAALPALRYVSVLATGFDNVDVAAAASLGIPVSNAPGYAAASVAQTAFGLLLELATGVGLHDRSVHEGEWVRSIDHTYWKRPITELAGLTLGIVGYGANGRAIAAVGAALGMKLIAYTPRLPQFAGPVSIGFVSLEQLFSRADAVVLACPQTAENARFVNARLLSLMKPCAFLVNVARGGLVNEADLAAALGERRIAGAGLDVVAREPMSADNPLLAAPNCVFTPHVAWASVAARKRLVAMTAENVASFLAGRPRHVVNECHLSRRRADARDEPSPVAVARPSAAASAACLLSVAHEPEGAEQPAT
jgi:glycerate dehydrogenase